LLAITLEDIMPTENWDKNLPTSSRFTVLVEFNNEAVRDNNTGLVWERSPETHDMDLKSAAAYCANKIIGGAVGWRLPSLIELKSVQDPSLPAPLRPIQHLHRSDATLLDGHGVFNSCPGGVGCELRQQQCGDHHQCVYALFCLVCARTDTGVFLLIQIQVNALLPL
jgi:hypothetical protein